jgi:hypothetical protein
MQKTDRHARQESQTKIVVVSVHFGEHVFFPRLLSDVPPARIWSMLLSFSRQDAPARIKFPLDFQRDNE